MVYIISELCGQWGGSIQRIEQMILQSKFSGANAVKIQLYDTYMMPGNNRKKWEYLNFSKDQFTHLLNYCNNLNIDFFASCFQEKYFKWIVDHNLKINKIASSTLTDIDFSEKMIKTGIKTYASLGHWKDKSNLPFQNYNNVEFLHCVSKYPHYYKEAIDLMPVGFGKNKLTGYSDHTIGIDSCKEAINRGAKVIEKHFTIDKSLQKETESAHICSMNWKELEKLRQYCEAIS